MTVKTFPMPRELNTKALGIWSCTADPGLEVKSCGTAILLKSNPPITVLTYLLLLC